MLVVEDDDTLRKVVQQQLHRFGVMCDTARSGEEAIELASRKRYRLILMDLRLPGMDGCSAAQRILELYGHNVAIVGVTAEDRREECIGVGMADYYQKPVMLQHLRQIIDRFLPAGGNSSNN